jgi:hypothetical protein
VTVAPGVEEEELGGATAGEWEKQHDVRESPGEDEQHGVRESPGEDSSGK